MIDAIVKTHRKCILCVNPRSGPGGQESIKTSFIIDTFLRINPMFLCPCNCKIPGALSLSPSPTGMPANNYIVPLLSPFSPATDEKSNIYYDSRGL